MSSLLSYCSWCNTKSWHKLVEQRTLSRNLYHCSSCEQQTVKCRYCDNMAKGPYHPEDHDVIKGKFKGFKATWSNELCAEHDHSTPSFSKANRKISDLSTYPEIFKPEKKNLAKIGTYAGTSTAGLAAFSLMLGSGGALAPIAVALGKTGALGAAGTGTAISSLSGAALSSASLAAIGSTGSLVITAVGGALGGSLGYGLSNQYIGEDKSFAIKRLRRKGPDTVLFINGFTQEKEDSFEDWKGQHMSCFPEETLYGVTWASKTRYDLGMAFGKRILANSGKKILEQIAKQGGKLAASKLNPLFLMLTASDMLTNPWHVALKRAEKTGAVVADAIARTKGREITLVGHSLGCRVIYHALTALSTKSDIFVRDVILLGGAIGRNEPEGWAQAQAAVSGKIYNCYSSQDMVLKRLYRTANAFLSDPAGVRPIVGDYDQIQNIDCSDFVDSHMTWKNHYERILRMIY